MRLHTRRCALAATLIFTGCVSSQVTRLAGYDPARRPTCREVVRIYASAEQIGAPHVEIAYIRASATDPVPDQHIVDKVLDEAAKVGANGIILRGIREETGRIGWGTGVLQAKPTGEAIALWVPRDSTGIYERCAVAPPRRQGQVLGRPRP